MKLRMLLILGLLSLAPKALLAQSTTVPFDAVIPAPPAAPEAPTAPRPPSPLDAVIAVAPEAPPLPPAPPAPSEVSQKPPKPPTLATPAAAPVPVAPPAPPAAPAPRAPRPPGQMINVRIDVTLSDSKGAPKVLTMTVADGENGMNRTTTAGATDYSFNADARATIVGDRIRLSLTADAVVPVDAAKDAEGRIPKLGLRQSQTVVLKDGESIEIARAADPTSDRSFGLSVKVTILR